jgi:hypothetical protein
MQLYTILTYPDKEQSKCLSIVKEMLLLAKEMIDLSK